MENRSTDSLRQTLVYPAPLSNLGDGRMLLYAIVSVFLFTTWIIRQQSSVGQLKFPVYKASKLKWIFSAEALIKESYSKFQDSIYQIKATEGVQVLVPSKYISELKGLPEHVLSSREALSEALLSEYTMFSAGHNSEILSVLVRTRLTQNLAELVPQLRSELEFSEATEFPDCGEWKAVKWSPFALRAIARLSGRAFVGPSINRREEWMNITTNFAVHAFTAVIKMQFMPRWLRPLGQYLVSDLRKVHRDIETAKVMLKPLLEERFRDMEMPTFHEPPNDLMQWLIEALPENEQADLHTHAHIQLILAAAAIHTTNNLLFECICDLAANPNILEELRDEAYQVLEVEGGWAHKESMAKLKKMDSFMKEVHRLRGNITSFIRKVKEPITLPDGTHFPVGTKILAPLAGMSFDERFYPEPEKLDALRFYRMRQESKEASNRWQFTSLHDTHLNFGTGKHACPGRFFAGNIIKLMLGYFIIHYDMRLKQGTARPMPMSFVMSKAPVADAEIEFRKRSLPA